MDPQTAPTIDYLAQQVKDLADAFRNHRHTGYDLTQKLYGTTLSKAMLVDNLSLGDGKSTSGTLTLKRASGRGSVYILGGTITAGDFSNAGGNTGFILGEDDADTLDKFYFGSASAYIKYDGVKLTVLGTISSLNIKTATDFENVAGARFTKTTGGTGAIALASYGADLTTGATATSFAQLQWYHTLNIFSGNPTFNAVMRVVALNAASGGGQIFIGLGTPAMNGSGTTFTSQSFCGFWFQKTGGAVNMYAIQNNGDAASYTTSSLLTTISDLDTVDLIFKMNGSTSVDYYWRKNSGSVSTKTTLSTRVPTSGDTDAYFIISNIASAFAMNIGMVSASLER